MARARQFIRNHAQRRMSVNDVVRESGLSRRALEKHFRDVLGRSILDEIRNARTDQIARLLAETNMSVTQIGSRLGFAHIKHLARYFRATRGMTPREYRKAVRRPEPSSFERIDKHNSRHRLEFVSSP